MVIKPVEPSKILGNNLRGVPLPWWFHYCFYIVAGLGLLVIIFKFIIH